MQNGDPQLLYRIVGFLEYGRALEHLDRLARISTPEEMKLYDSIIGEREELSLPTNISRHVQRQPSSLAEPPVGDADDFVRSGMSWMTALARVELGAMLAGFSPSPRPFQAVAPTSFDRKQYHELLLDGARTHYWTLSGDPALQRTLSQPARKVYIAALSYGRRLAVARAMLQSAQQLASVDYAPQQAAEMRQWKSQLDQVQTNLLGMVRELLGARSFVSTSSQDREFTRACGALLQAERRELQVGTARVEQIGQ